SGTPLQTSRPCGRWVIGGFSGATIYENEGLSLRHLQAPTQSQRTATSTDKGRHRSECIMGHGLRQ
ncbi:hypothetical protein VDQ63_14335, partial [Xanthomonas campestris pv. campestris]|nr:hypothetical protein [Xanthomonas campestris pv. campestris]MEB1240494.1 hypothetical protein [Xanthomonas campestris pv. campestris]MEB1574282.1 hypothetical protein [Xanthomonas campestris pv. campestris]MEB1685041.1 hypothetical protein [Xanthomonas campestris pv. campestris]MEB1709480.1 hypothetical protein [Xanthomonas campestris pv. campestris]